MSSWKKTPSEKVKEIKEVIEKHLNKEDKYENPDFTIGYIMGILEMKELL